MSDPSVLSNDEGPVKYARAAGIVRIENPAVARPRTRQVVFGAWSRLFWYVDQLLEASHDETLAMNRRQCASTPKKSSIAQTYHCAPTTALHLHVLRLTASLRESSSLHHDVWLRKIKAV
jgi:hypothetical protein